MSKRVFVYCQETPNIYGMINEMKRYVSEMGWKLKGGVVDFCGSSDRLFEIQDLLDSIDAILIYSEDDLEDFNLQFLKQLLQMEEIELIKYKTG
jgi:hypothetical protein